VTASPRLAPSHCPNWGPDTSRLSSYQTNEAIGTPTAYSDLPARPDNPGYRAWWNNLGCHRASRGNFPRIGQSTPHRVPARSSNAALRSAATEAGRCQHRPARLLLASPLRWHSSSCIGRGAFAAPPKPAKNAEAGVTRARFGRRHGLKCPGCKPSLFRLRDERSAAVGKHRQQQRLAPVLAAAAGGGL
jgi:hypothetical protein